MGARAYRTSKQVQQRGIHKFRGASVSLEDDDVVRTISAQDLTKLGLHIDYAHSISLGYSKENTTSFWLLMGLILCQQRKATPLNKLAQSFVYIADITDML
jgi:hypothetical protein